MVTECRCLPCPGRGTDGHGMEHCAECCWGTRVVAEPDCPEHGEVRYAAGWQDATARALDAAARTSMSSSELATLRDALTPGGGS